MYSVGNIGSEILPQGFQSAEGFGHGIDALGKFMVIPVVLGGEEHAEIPTGNSTHGVEGVKGDEALVFGSLNIKGISILKRSYYDGTNIGVKRGVTLSAVLSGHHLSEIAFHKKRGC